MKPLIVLLALLGCALSGHATSISTPPVQNVRFASEIGPTDLVTAPKVLTHPAAAHTDEARRRGIRGSVIVQAYFDADGSITVLKVVKGLGYGLDENALAASKPWRFSPALGDGLPVRAVAEIHVSFNLEADALRQIHRAMEQAHQQLEKAHQMLQSVSPK